MNGAAVSTNVRQCDLHRTLTVQDSTRSYVVRPDVENSPDAKEPKDTKEKSAASNDSASTGGLITYRSTIKDLGEHKQILGYNARHLKMSILAEADGEDVMTPVLTQLATTVLTEAVKQ